MLTFVNRKLSTFSETVDACTPINEELKFLLDLVSYRPQDILSEGLGVVRDLGFKLDGIFVDTLDLLLVEVDLEVVGEELESTTRCLWVSSWLLWEKCEGS